MSNLSRRQILTAGTLGAVAITTGQQAIANTQTTIVPATEPAKPP